MTRIPRFALSIALLTGLLVTRSPLADDADATAAEEAASEAAREAALAEAVRELDIAQQAVAEARATLAGDERSQEEAEALAREELSRGHRALREASREVARAHRELAVIQRAHFVGLGDRAVIGVLLGEATPEGIAISGITPGGPAEKAGLQQGDVLTSIRGEALAGKDGADPNAALFRIMDSVKPGEELPVKALRDGKAHDFTITAEQREPIAWQSMLRLQAPPTGAHGPHHGPGGSQIIVERMVSPDDAKSAQAWEQQIDELTEQAREFEQHFIDEGGIRLEIPDELEIEGAPFSGSGLLAIEHADMLFGPPHLRGLRLASINPRLGRYFEVESGVLVLDARADDAYGLEAGDVIVSAGGKEVKSTADLLRVLRDAAPGSELELSIQRDRRAKTLKAVVPESRLGFMHHGLPPIPAPPPIEH